MLKLLYRSVLSFSVIIVFLEPAKADLNFDPAMISGDVGAVADLSRFASQGVQLPGTYLVDIYLNNVLVDTRSVRFLPMAADQSARNSMTHDNTGLLPCLTKNELANIGVNVPLFPELVALPIEQCAQPAQFIPQAWTAFNFQQMRLDISIPQVALQNRPEGWIAPEQWDEGINALLMSWQFSGSKSQGAYSNSSNQFLNLTTGVNLGPWRLRDNSTWSYQESAYSHTQHWQHLNTYLQRSIIPWRSDLKIGDSTTGGDVFDPLSFRGVQLATDDNMYPETMRGFAPIINGIASSSAEVSIRQNGTEIYRTTVAAGNFSIKDLYPLSSGGDLEVVVTEANGAVKVFTVPYSSVPILQRAGHKRYSLTAGRYRSSSSSYDNPTFLQGTLLYGLPHDVTTYGGMQLAEKYRSIALGAGINMGGWGAISADVTQARSVLADDSRHQGQSLRLLYGRSLISTGTTFQLATYRYSSSGFHTLDETALRGMSGWTADTDKTVDASGRPVERDWINYYNLYSNKRQRMQVSISQRIGDLGSLNLTGSKQTYWNDTASTTSLQAGFSSAWGNTSYSISYGYTRYNGQPTADKTLWLSLSIPLDDMFGKNVWATYNTNRDSNSHVSQQVGLSGAALDENNLYWGVTQGYSRSNGASGDLSLDYRGTYGNASAGYAYSKNYRQWRYGTSGSAVLHANGLTLGQPLGATNVLISAPGAAGIPLTNGTGVKTDWRGYTVVPYASAYRENRVALDVSKLDSHTEIDNAVSRVVPTQGAIVRANFQPRIGIRALFTLLYRDKPLPFGTMVSVQNGANSLVGDNGQVFLSGLKQDGLLTAKWGSLPNQQCTVRFVLPEMALKTPLTKQQAVCQ